MIVIEEANNGATASLATRISDCIAEADAGGRHLVAAHLDAALSALRGRHGEAVSVTGRDEPFPREQSVPRRAE